MSRRNETPRGPGPQLVALLDAIRQLDAPPPCTEPSIRDEFTHDDATRRAVARRHCEGCPVLVACLDAARAERAFGVWAGRDHDPTRPDRDTTWRGHHTMPKRDPFKLPTTDARIHEDDHDAAVTRVARRILAGVPFEGANPADLRRALAGRDRHLFDEALRRLTWGQRVEVVETWNGERLVVPVYALDGLDAPGILRDVLDEVGRLQDTVRTLLRAVEGRP